MARVLGLPFNKLSAGPAPPGATPVTWDPLQKTSHILLSGGNLTATAESTGVGDDAWAIQATKINFVGRKLYWEVTFSTNDLGEATALGVGPQIANFATFFNGPGCGIVVFQAAGPQLAYTGWDNDVNFQTQINLGPAGFTPITTVMIAYDQPGNLFYAGINGGWLIGNPTVPSGGHTVTNTPAFIEMDFEGNLGVGVTTHHWARANFGASSLLYPVPSGFTNLSGLS